MLLSHKIMLTMIVWTVLAIGVSSGSDYEIFFIIEMIGFLIIRELVDSFATTEIKERLDVFFYIGLTVFMAMLLRRIFIVLY
jgi:hypothetical protein